MASSEDDVVYAVTPFPDLNAEKVEISVEDGSAQPKIVVSGLEAGLSEEEVETRVTLAWALLLREYTARDIIVFRRDDGVVGVDFTSGSVQVIEAFDGDETQLTAVYVKSVS